MLLGVVGSDHSHHTLMNVTLVRVLKLVLIKCRGSCSLSYRVYEVLIVPLRELALNQSEELLYQQGSPNQKKPFQSSEVDPPSVTLSQENKVMPVAPW